MKKTMLLFLLLILAGSLASAFGQSGGACTNSSVLQCAGGWIGTDSVTPPIPLPYTNCDVSLEGSHRTYTATYGGGYNDFKGNPDGSISWYSVQVPDQIVSSVDTCYAPCITTTPIMSSALLSLIGVSQCPLLFDQIAPPVDGWTEPPDSAPDGSIMGARPLFRSGWVDPRIDCNSVSVAPLSLDVANVTICTADTAVLAGNLGTYMGAPSPSHCAFVQQTSGTTPPTCSCGYQAICNGGGEGTGHWGCPPEFTNVVYLVTGGGCDPNGYCTCTYEVSDNYDCGIYVGSVYVLVEEDCPPQFF